LDFKRVYIPKPDGRVRPGAKDGLETVPALAEPIPVLYLERERYRNHNTGSSQGEVH
jgi:hypothetical protein